MADMVKGNHAMAEAAIRAGMHIYCGYPITPSSEVMEYLSANAEKAGRVYIQAENEVSAMTMIYGAASVGARALTATSGLGMSLKQEGIAYCQQFEYPAVLISVVRYGDGLGQLLSGQTDYLRETRGGANGDYRNIVLSPSSVQEACDLVYGAFDLSQKYRNIVTILTEGALGQMMEECEFPPMREKIPYAQWGMDGTKGPNNVDPKNLRANMWKQGQEIMNVKRELMRENEQRWESEFLEDAEWVMFAYGMPGRVMKGVVRAMRAEGEKVGYIRLISLWPFPEKAFKAINPKVKGFISMETCDEGQMVEDVALYGRKRGSGFGDVPIYSLICMPGVPSRQYVREKFEDIRSGKVKEVF